MGEFHEPGENDEKNVKIINKLDTSDLKKNFEDVAL